MPQLAPLAASWLLSVGGVYATVAAVGIIVGSPAYGLGRQMKKRKDAK
jgi:hypothetical protein